MGGKDDRERRPGKTGGDGGESRDEMREMERSGTCETGAGRCESYEQGVGESRLERDSGGRKSVAIISGALTQMWQLKLWNSNSHTEK